MSDARNAPIDQQGQASTHSQAQFYRAEAARLREAATSLLFGDLQTDFLMMAQQYEILARQAEANARWANTYSAARRPPADERVAGLRRTA